MKFFHFFLVTAILGLGYSTYAQVKTKQKQKAAVPKNFHELKAKSIDGETINFSAFKGKYVLVVNTASKCGYTYQYGDLEKLAQKFKNKLVVIGFPSNDFLWQEPGSNKTIKQFCSAKRVTFPMCEKVKVKGKEKHPVYKWLTNKNLNGFTSQKPTWNFNKYLIDPHGKLIQYFGSGVKPLSPQITDLIK